MLHPPIYYYITQKPKKAPRIDKTFPRDRVKLLPSAKAIALFASSWVEDGTGGFPALPPEVFPVEGGGLIMPLDPWGWGANPFGDSCGGKIMIGTWEGEGDGDGDGGFCEELSWTEIAIFWPRQQ